MMTIYLIVVMLLVLAAWLTQKIDLPGAFIGGAITLILLIAIGWLGLWLIGGFYISGTLASVWKFKEKQQYGIAEKNRAKRGMNNVLANAGLATLIGLFSLFFSDYHSHLEVLIAACFASATSDTLSSELGNVYGTRYVNIVTLKTDQKGKDGIISWEGILFGVLGSLFIALLYVMNRKFNEQFIIIVVAGLIGNLADSILGATLQQKAILNNHTVNVANTLIASVVAFVLQKLLV